MTPPPETPPLAPPPLPYPPPPLQIPMNPEADAHTEPEGGIASFVVLASVSELLCWILGFLAFFLVLICFRVIVGGVVVFG